MILKRALWLISLTISTYILSAQNSGFLPGYVITNSSDTIKGWVKYINQIPYRVLSDIKFKVYENSDERKYSPLELIGYKAEDKIFHSVATSRKESSKKFMELIEDGYLKIYKRTYSTLRGSMDGVYAQSEDYLQKSDGSVAFKLDYADWNEKVSQYLSDNEILSNGIRNGAYKWKELPDIVKEYNASHH